MYGVLWRLSARDLAAINAYESVDSGLYVRRHLSVRCGATQAIALVYIARRRGEGLPRPGHIPLVVEAVKGKQMSVGRPYFDSMVVPVGAALLFLIGIGPALPWGRATREQLMRALPQWPACA